MAATRDPAKLYTGLATIVGLVPFWYLGSKAGIINAQGFTSPEQFGAAARRLLIGDGFGDDRLHRHFPQEQFDLGTLGGHQR